MGYRIEMFFLRILIIVVYVNYSMGRAIIWPFTIPSLYGTEHTGTVPEFVDILSDLGHVVLRDAELLGLLLLRHNVPGKQRLYFLQATCTVYICSVLFRYTV